MATSQEKIFMNILQLKNEKDWLVWKFQVQHTLKAADQYQFMIGTANADTDNYESKKHLLNSTVHRAEVYADGHEL